MKIALLVALCAVAAVSSYNTPVHSSVFKPGEQYIYHYKGQVLSGLPKTSSQYAGLLIDSIVVLQFQQDFKVVMKMEKIKLFKIHNKISTLPGELLPESELTHLTGEQSEVITEQLVKPIKFRYEEGEVRDVEKEVSDRFWSVNIKKGVLSLFQITLKEKNTYNTDYSTSYDPTMSRIKSNPRSSSYNRETPYWKQLSKSNSVYKVMETDVTGNCETKYTIISDKTHLSTSSSKLKVTAVRNFDNCVNKPFYIQGLFQGVYRYEAENDLVQPMVHFDYDIVGDRTHFLIKEVTLRGKYFFLLNGLEGGDMSTYIVQHLKLKTTEPLRTPIRLSSPKVDTLGLMMVIPQSTLHPEKKSVEDTNSQYVGYRRKVRMELDSPKNLENSWEETETEEPLNGEIDDIMTVVDTKLSELMQCLYPMSDKKCSLYIMEISRIIRQANKHQLKSIVTRYLKGETSEIETRKAEIITDLLPTLPSPDAGKVIIELIKERLISKIRGQILIKAMSMHIKPTPTLIKNVLELYKEQTKERTSSVSATTLLRQSLLLSVGTLTHRLITVMRSHSKPIPEVISFIDSISSELKRMLEETSSEQDKILILKSMGNMGASETIPTLRQLVEDPSVPLPIRVNAVFALRRLAKQFNKQVVPILMSVFMDVKEHRELRQSAFVVIINANPSYITLQMIAHRLRHEPHAQIRTLVYSSLINLASYTSHEPEHKTLAQNARLIIKNIPPVRVAVQDSMSLLLNKFSDDLDLGAALNIIKIKSKMSGLPESIVANIQGTLFGKHRRLLEVGASGRSLEVILRKIFGPHGLLKEILKGQVTLKDVLRPLATSELGGVEIKIREILSKMMHEIRSEETPFGSWYVHVLGNELQYIMVNSETVEDLVNKLTNFLPELLMKLTRGIKVDVIKAISSVQSLTIASPIGIPLTLNYTTMGVFKVNGHVKVNNLPTWPEMVGKFSSYSSVPKLSLDVDLKPFVDVMHTLAMGVDMRWLATDAGTYVHVRAMSPVKFSVHGDLQKQTVSVKYFTPNETVKVLHVTATPVTFIKYFPTTINKLPFTLEVKDIKGEEFVKVTPFEHRFTESITGMNVETKGLYSLCGPTWCPTYFGKQELSIVTLPVTTNDYVHLKIKSLRSNFEFEGIPSSNTDELFDDETDENTDDESTYRPTNYRTSSRSLRESGDFEPIRVDPVFEGEPIKRQILITLGPNTTPTPKVKSLVTWLMGRRYLKHQLNLQIVRLTRGETPSWKIHLNKVVNPVEWDTSLTPYSPETEFLTKTHLMWTINGEMKELKTKLVPGSPFDFSRELKEHSIITPFTLPEANAQKIKYTVEVDLPHLSHKMLKYITVVHDAIKYQFYDSLTTGIPHTPLNNKIIISAEVLPWWEQMNIIVKTPRENSYISSVPFSWNPFLPTNQKIRLHDLPSWMWYKNSSDVESFVDTVPYKSTRLSRTVSGECSIDESLKMSTYDDADISFGAFKDMVDCKMVLTQHCSNQGLFSVIGGGSTENWTLKVLVPKNEFEFVFRSRKLTFIVNEEEKHLRVSQPWIIRDESGNKLYTIEKIEEGVIEIKAHELKMHIIVDSVKLMTRIKISPLSMLQGQLCGLCGNFNQDPSDDFYTTSDFKSENHEVARLLKNNVYGHEQCNFDTIQQKSSEYCLKESHHMTIRRYDNDTPMTCSSVRKLPKCSKGCRPETTESVKTCFTCRSEEGENLPRKTYVAPRWDSYDSNVECEDFFQRVEVPTRCVPTY